MCPFDPIRQELEPVFAEVGRAGGVTIRFAHEDKQAHQNSQTFYLSYEGPLPVAARPKEVKVNITIKEEVVFALKSRRVLRAYEARSRKGSWDLVSDQALHSLALGALSWMA
jgi:hypothetical protein